jgi:hypothetical protein
MNFTRLTYSMVTLIYGRVYCKVDGVAALVLSVFGIMCPCDYVLLSS